MSGLAPWRFHTLRTPASELCSGEPASRESFDSVCDWSTDMRALIAVSLLVTACSNAGSELGLTPFTSRVVVVTAYLDRDGSASLTSADTGYSGAKIIFRPVGGGQAAFSATTLAGARIQVASSIPVGEYSTTVDPATIGDSL